MQKMTLVPGIATCDAASTGAKYFLSQHPILVYTNNVYLVNVYIRIHIQYTLYTIPCTPNIPLPPLLPLPPPPRGERGGGFHPPIHP